ncbi:MAG TPA: hypothetical protein VHO72_07360 [Bacteroidales bacterium]|nr:hypothetical protein [Bacteroidales bacterium]
MLKIYLYFVSKTKEPDTWDNQFSNFLYRMLTQVTGMKISFYSNFGITECEQVNIDKVNCSDYDAVLVILQEKEYHEWNDDLIAFVFRRAIDAEISKFFLVRKFASQEQIASELLNRLSQYPFYEFNHRTLQYLEYSPDKRGEREDGFWSKISDITYDIKYIANRTLVSPERITTDIYLAEVSKDQLKNRERLKRELILAGYNVLPHYPLPRNKNDFEQAVSGLLSKSFLSVNILGELYGDAPEDVDYSYCEIQNRVFDNYYKHNKSDDPDSNIKRIIWLPPLVEFYEEKQAQYIKRLRKEQFAKTNTEMVQCSISDLRKIIDKMYFEATSNSGKQSLMADGASRFLVIADSETYYPVLNDLSGKQNVAFDIFRGNQTDAATMISVFKRYKNFIVISSSSPWSWGHSLIGYIMRSKGYVDSQQDTSIGIFTAHKGWDSDHFKLFPASVTHYPINQANLVEQIKVHLARG